jgi:hypothetical protein
MRQTGLPLRGRALEQMEEHPDTDQSSDRQAPVALSPRLPSRRLSALLAAAMLGLGVFVGAAIGPAPEMSFAGNSTEITKRLLLLASVAAERRNEANAAAAASAAAAAVAAKESEPAQSAVSAAAEESPSTAAASGKSKESSAGEKEGSEEEEKGASKKNKLPPVSSIWLIELSGPGFSAALAQPTASPFITQTVAQGTLLSGWSALSASAFAGEAGIVEPPSADGTPPLLRTIVQPACPEGAAGAACAPETPGQLTAADEFLKATLATITTTALYKENGLVVITFATVALANQVGLPEGAASSTLTYRPPVGALLLSPFAKAGKRSSVAFNPTSPRKSVEALLHK